MAVDRSKTKTSPRAPKKLKNVEKTKNKNENKVLLVAQEIKFARLLAGNEKKTRDKAMRSLRKWLAFRSASTYPFADSDFMRLWKGLFYCVWMSDKPLIQEELCENIAKLLNCFDQKNLSTCILFYNCFLRTMAENWFGIDQHRIDKFLMLVRRLTRSVLSCVSAADWCEEALQQLCESLSGAGGVFSPQPPLEARLGLGLQMHLTDIWMEEVAKVSEGELSARAVVELSRPFARYLSHGEESRLASSITTQVFTHLIRQTDIGMDYEDKLKAWRDAGYPGGSIDTMERVEPSDDDSEDAGDDNDDDDDDENKKPKEDDRKVGLDPRAGGVDAVLPQLPVDGALFCSMFRDLVRDAQLPSNIARLKGMAKHFEVLSGGSYPFPCKDFKLPNDPALRLNVDEATEELLEFESRCKEDHDDLKGMGRRKRRRAIQQQMEASDDEDEPKVAEPPKPKRKRNNSQSCSGDWDVQDLPSEQAKSKTDTKTQKAKKGGKKQPPQEKSTKKKADASEGKANKVMMNGETTKKQSPKVEKKPIPKDTIALLNGTPNAFKNGLRKESSSTPVSTKKTKKQSPKVDKSTSIEAAPSVNKKELRDRSVEKVDTPKKGDATPKKAETPKRLGLLKRIDTLKKVDVAKKVETPKKGDSTPKKVDAPQKEVTPKKVETPKKVDAPQKGVTPKKDETPKKKETPEVVQKVEDVGKVSKSPNSTPNKKMQKKLKSTDETEIFIPIGKNQKKKMSPQRLNLSDSNIFKAKTRTNNLKNHNMSLNSSPSSKKVMIALKKNTSQAVMDYFKSVKQSPEIPFDSNKKPLKTSLKPNSMPSPINPFYKKKLKLNF